MEGPRRDRISDAPEPQSERLRRQQRLYLVLMGICITLVVVAWVVVRQWSTTAAILMTALAAPIPPVAVLIANRGEDH